MTLKNGLFFGKKKMVFVRMFVNQYVFKVLQNSGYFFG